MACQYNASLTSSLDATALPQGLLAEFPNTSINTKFEYVPQQASLSPSSLTANLTASLALSTIITLQASVEDPIPQEACVFVQPLS